jgi:fumarate hydratase class II
MMPVLARNVLESIRLLAAVARLFADRCVAGIAADAERCRTFAESSPQVATALNRFLGYDEVASIVKQAVAEKRTIRDVVVERGHVSARRISEADLSAALDVLRLTRPASD